MSNGGSLKRNPEQQASLHMVTEAIAVLAIAPITFYIARSNPELPKWQRNFLYGVAAVTVVVDGYLLIKWVAEARTQSQQSRDAWPDLA